MTAPMSPACAALLKAFNPGDGSALRVCTERDWQVPGAQGGRVTLEFDLAGEFARARAAKLIRQADVLVSDALRLGGTPQRAVHVAAWVGTGSVFTVDALVLQA